jgi:anti-anti-sigma factor
LKLACAWRDESSEPLVCVGRQAVTVKLIQAGDFVTREFPIKVDEFNIGRDYTCDLRLDHGRISRNHCRILKRGNRVLVEALYSTAGTAVNHQILDPSAPPFEVYDGDHLWVGPEHFQFVFSADPGSPVEPSERPPTAGRPRLAEGEELTNPLMKDVPTTQSRVAHKLLERMSEPPPAEEEEEEEEDASPATPAAPAEPLGPIDVTNMEGVAMVRLLPKALVADSDIRTITDELDDLIASGQNCITLNLGNVERMSSQVIGEVLGVYKRCKAKGGMLKICRVTPQVASVFAMTNMERHIEIFPDESLALKSIWPIQSVAEKPRAAERKAAPTAAAPAAPTAPAAPAGTACRVRLIVEIGRAKGREIDLRLPRFLIGRDQQCQLRPNSNAISRLHAAIEQREGRVFVRDLGSQIGTALGGRLLRNEEAEAFNGDRLQIEMLQFTFAIGSPADAPAPSPTDGSLSGLFNAHSTDPSADTAIMSLAEISSALANTPGATTPATAPTDPNRPKRSRHLTYQIVDDVAVVMLRVTDMSEESVFSAVRVELEDILAEPGIDRMIIRFDHVALLSRGAVVMFLARAQHLVRSNGTMRFCNVSPAVMSFLDKTQLPLLIEIFPTLEEALQTPWESEEQSGTTAQTGGAT